MLISSSHSLVSSSASFTCKTKINMKIIFYVLSSIYLQITHHLIHSPSGPGSSPVTAPSFAPAAAGLEVQIPPTCSWTAPQRSLHLLWRRTTNGQSDISVSIAFYTIITAESGFLLANFLLSVGFEGLVALLLLLDPCQIVLSASFQSPFILMGMVQKTINQSNS